ncbi:predicted protein [Nematostella vectensis]|uniref:G-protein coupled receptors family 1 profile domain-containing protein n=1 Tax=Nematostella vectensis TaxID=45351 RepID=A7S0P3_NEMVE|nr:predicted protein [Nematostella vectensis]|eukprot:XP_001634835.1 predicted protein [Nematostella vectensis]
MTSIATMTEPVTSNSSLKTPPTERTSFDLPLKVISTIFLLLIIILTIAGNGLVISAFAKFRKLRSVTNHFVVSLALTDILVAVFSMPMWAAFLLTGPEWIYTEWLRRVWQCADVLSGVASILHLTFISVERYICISSPLKYHQIVTPGKTKVAIIAIWMVALIMAAIKFLFWGWPPPAYQLSAFVFCFTLPTIIMNTAYIMIFKVSRTQAKKMTMTVNGKPKRFCLPKEMKAAKTLAVVMGAFFFCWCPFFILNLVYAVCRECPIDIESIMLTKWLHYLNSVLNPFIYSFMIKDFRMAFRKLVIHAVTSRFRGRELRLYDRGFSSTRNNSSRTQDQSLRGYDPTANKGEQYV